MKRIILQIGVFIGSIMCALPAYAGEHASEGGKKMLPAFDVALFPGVLFWMIVTFVVLMIVMQFFALPNVQKTIDNRQETLDQDLEQARKMGERAQETVKAYEDQLHKARMNANKTVGDIVAKAEEEAAAQLEAQSKEIRKKLSVTHDKIVKAKEEAVKDAMPFVSDIVDEVYNKVMQSGFDNQVKGAK